LPPADSLRLGLEVDDSEDWLVAGDEVVEDCETEEDREEELDDSSRGVTSEFHRDWPTCARRRYRAADCARGSDNLGAVRTAIVETIGLVAVFIHVSRTAWARDERALTKSRGTSGFTYREAELKDGHGGAPELSQRLHSLSRVWVRGRSGVSSSSCEESGLPGSFHRRPRSWQAGVRGIADAAARRRDGCDSLGLGRRRKLSSGEGEQSPVSRGPKGTPRRRFE